MASREAVLARLRRDVVGLCGHPTRCVGTPGHAAARRYLATRYRALDLQPYGERFELPYEHDGLRFTNLVAVAPGAPHGVRPSTPPAAAPGVPPAPAPVVIAAHYDSVAETPGADDNAAAVAVAREVAARVRAAPAARPVVVAQFDAEEPPFFHTPCMGSTHFHHHQATGPIHAAIVLDLVGHAIPVPGIEDVVFVMGMESDPDLEGTIGSLPGALGVHVVTALNRYVGDMSDHHTFRLGRVPYLFLSCGRWQHYHAPSDTPEVLAWSKIAATADLTEALVRDVAERALAGPWEGYDTTRTDRATMGTALGPLLAATGMRIESREDIDRVAATLLQRFAL
jgi:hypothetical protein